MKLKSIEFFIIVNPIITEEDLKIKVQDLSEIKYLIDKFGYSILEIDVEDEDDVNQYVRVYIGEKGEDKK